MKFKKLENWLVGRFIWLGAQTSSATTEYVEIPAVLKKPVEIPAGSSLSLRFRYQLYYP